MSEKKQPVDLGLLEEDDEFEEFPAEGNCQAARWAPAASGAAADLLAGPGRGPGAASGCTVLGVPGASFTVPRASVSRHREGRVQPGPTRSRVWPSISSPGLSFASASQPPFGCQLLQNSTVVPRLPVLPTPRTVGMSPAK